MVKYCPNCGTPNDDSAQFCIKCGYQFPAVQPSQWQGAQQAQPSQAYPQQPNMQQGYYQFQKVPRPAGVLALGILQILYSLLIIGVASFIAAILPPVLSWFSILLIGIAIISLLIAIAFMTGRNWARILMMIGAVLDLLSIPVGTIIGIILLVYLTRPHVVAYFKQPK